MKWICQLTFSNCSFAVRFYVPATLVLLHPVFWIMFEPSFWCDRILCIYRCIPVLFSLSWLSMEFRVTYSLILLHTFNGLNWLASVNLRDVPLHSIHSTLNSSFTRMLVILSRTELPKRWQNILVQKFFYRIIFPLMCRILPRLLFFFYNKNFLFSCVVEGAA